MKKKVIKEMSIESKLNVLGFGMEKSDDFWAARALFQSFENCLGCPYLFDKDCNKCKGKVYELRPIDITKKVNKEIIVKSREMNELDEIRDSINFTNMDKFKNLIPPKH
jgi:hypothetical protein